MYNGRLSAMFSLESCAVHTESLNQILSQLSAEIELCQNYRISLGGQKGGTAGQGIKARQVMSYIIGHILSVFHIICHILSVLSFFSSLGTKIIQYYSVIAQP